MPTVFLGLGSNLGNRLVNLQAAIAALPPAVVVQACSRIYETAPWGYLDQPAFLNQALKAETKLSPHDLLTHIKSLEVTMGRTPTFQFGPRQIDIDLLFYDDLVLTSPDLMIPHPRLQERAFVLVPLADLAPELIHPVLGKRVSELLAGVDQRGVKPYRKKSHKKKGKAL